MSELQKRDDQGHGPFAPPPHHHGPSAHNPNSAPPPTTAYNSYSGHSGPHGSFSPGTTMHNKMKHSFPSNGVPPVTPPHMPGQQHHVTPQQTTYGRGPSQYHHHTHHNHRAPHGPPAGSFVPYNPHPIEPHEARGHHHRHGPHVSRSGSESLGEAPASPEAPKVDAAPVKPKSKKSTKGKAKGKAMGKAKATASPPAPADKKNVTEAGSSFADFEPPRTEVFATPSLKRQNRHETGVGDRAPTTPRDTKKQRIIEASLSKDNIPLSPTLTFPSRCDSFRGGIGGASMSFGMPGHDAQILHSWSGSFGMGRPSSPSDIQVCYDGWNPNLTSSPGGPLPSIQRSPVVSQTLLGPRLSWDDAPIPLGSMSMIDFDDSKAGTVNHPKAQSAKVSPGAPSAPPGQGQKLPPSPVLGAMPQGSFGPPPPPPLPHNLSAHESRSLGPANKSGHVVYCPGGRSYAPAPRGAWYEATSSFPSPHGRVMERRDEMGQLSSPRGGWSQDYVPAHGNSFGYHQSPGRSYPQMLLRHDDSMREQSPPFISGSNLQQHQDFCPPTNSMAPPPVQRGPPGQLRTPDGALLLAMEDDRISLSETLCLIRENVEVFCATEDDVNAPAPGRKRAVTVGQIGLRCIHCRHADTPGERVKRAMCFPSSLKRIYRTIIDMKLDHFRSCPFIPIDVKTKLEDLSATNGRSTGTTMSYFVAAAKKLGCIDDPDGNGVRYDPTVVTGPTHNPNVIQPLGSVGSHSSYSPGQPQRLAYDPISFSHSQMSFDRQIGLSSSGSHGMGHPGPVLSNTSMLLQGSGSSLSMGSFGATSDGIRNKASEDYSIDSSSAQFFHGKVLLSQPDDKNALSPLRCFLRQNVIAFTATAEDIAVRTPTSFTIHHGQVGVGCAHCYRLPAKERSNRAVCFPFSISRIYQSVADIQRFHFGECKMIPQEVRDKFTSLQNASSKGSKGLATRSYWLSSAKRLGLADTMKGIRFIRDPQSPSDQPVSLDILAQVASDVTTASKPLVLPEDKPYIADFIYEAMLQVRPCRFTDADRNKRRNKNVGCVGVECKHCAGNMEGRKFFWSSISAVESNFVSVHTHMMECKFVPQEVKDTLAEKKLLRKEHTSKLKVGSQKAFFTKIWDRLHENEAYQRQLEEQQKLKLAEQQEKKKKRKRKRKKKEKTNAPASPTLSPLQPATMIGDEMEKIQTDDLQLPELDDSETKEESL